MRINLSRVLVAAFASVCVAVQIGGTLSAQAGWTVVMSGLDHPRGLAVGPEGGLYVAEAGRGGSGPCQTVLPTEPPRCFGLSGAITRLYKGVQERVVTGLPSQANATGATGPHDISFIGRGGAYVSIGSGGHPNLRPGWGPGGELFGTVVHMPTSGRWRVVADIAAFEFAANPDRGVIDSNAFGLLAEPATRFVADAGGNALLQLDPNGDLSVVATFPARLNSPRGTDAVPTDVVRGPDGALYVSELAGVNFAAGLANIWRVVPGSTPTVHRSGLQTVIDLDFGPDGSLYYLEHASGVFFSGPGRIVRVPTSGAPVVVASGLTRPTSLLVTDDGTVYVTNNGVTPGAGQVLKIN
jgi:glucose/arabinose dehydrogenase